MVITFSFTNKLLQINIFKLKLKLIGRYKAILDDHKGFVQGVAWDPLNVYAATLSSDR